MSDELNHPSFLNDADTPETRSYTETDAQAPELFAATESPSYRETVSYEETSSATKPKELSTTKNAKTTARLLSTVTATVASVAVGVVALPGVSSQSDVKATFSKLVATDRYISYIVELENYQPSDEIVIVVSNDFTKRKQKVSSATTEGMQNDLQSGMKYTVSVMDGTRKLAEKTVKTGVYSSYFQDVAWECKCSLDGFFYFQMEYADESGWWTDFSATLTDGYGNVAECVFSEDLNALQKIDVEGFGLRGETAELLVTCRSEHKKDKDGKPVLLTLYQERVNI